MVCSDPEEHRRRVETRGTDVAGLVKPAWDDVVAREYEPWTRRRLVVDSAAVAPGEAARQVAAAVLAARHGGST